MCSEHALPAILLHTTDPCTGAATAVGLSELTPPIAVVTIRIAHVVLPSTCDSLSDAQGLAVANMHRDELWLTLTLHRDELCLTCTCGKHVADWQIDLWVGAPSCSEQRPPALSHCCFASATISAAAASRFGSGGFAC